MLCCRTARNAIIVIIASSMAAVLYHNDIEKFTLTGNITSGIPPFKPPSFTLTHGNHTFTVADFFEVSLNNRLVAWLSGGSVGQGGFRRLRARASHQQRASHQTVSVFSRP